MTEINRALGIDESFDELLRADLRELTAHRLPDGRRFWDFRGRLEVEDGSGFKLLTERSNGRAYFSRTFSGSLWFFEADGQQVRFAAYTRLFDLYSLQVVEIQKGLYPLVRADVWVVTEGQGRQTTISLMDPVTRKRRDMPGARKGDRIGPSFMDGSFLLLRWRSARPWSGELEAIYHVRDPKIGDMRRVKTPVKVKLFGLREPWLPAYTPSGARILRSSRGHWFRFDRSNSRLIPAARIDGRLMACESEDRILVQTDRTIVRLHFGSNRKEQLFPRPAGDQR